MEILIEIQNAHNAQKIEAPKSFSLTRGADIPTRTSPNARRCRASKPQRFGVWGRPQADNKMWLKKRPTKALGVFIYE